MLVTAVDYIHLMPMHRGSPTILLSLVLTKVRSSKVSNNFFERFIPWR